MTSYTETKAAWCTPLFIYSFTAALFRSLVIIFHHKVLKFSRIPPFTFRSQINIINNVVYPFFLKSAICTAAESMGYSTIMLRRHFGVEHALSLVLLCLQEFYRNRYGNVLTLLSMVSNIASF